MPPTLTITPLIVTLDVGETLQLTVSPNPNGVKWFCDTCHVASVDNNGLVTGLAFGNCIITGRRGNQSVSVAVTVIDVDPPDPPIPPPAVTIQAINGSTEADLWVLSTEGTAPGEGDSFVQHTFDPGDGSAPITLPGAPALQIEHTFPSDGNFTVRLTVLTQAGYVQFSEFVATVLPVESPEPPDPPDPDISPIAAIAHVSGIYSGQPVTFTTANTQDIDGTIVGYVFNPGDGTQPQTGPFGPPLFLTHTYATPGTRTARLTVTDDDGLSGIAEVQVTTVLEPTPNQPPIPKLVKTAGAFAGDTYVFSTLGSNDPDGSLASGTFQSGTGTVQTWTGNPPLNLSTVYPTAGNFTARLTLVDDDGAQTAVNLAVTVATIPAPGTDARFDTLMARPERFAGVGLRSNAEIAQYIHNSSHIVTRWAYDPSVDAAKLTWPTDRASIEIGQQIFVPLSQSGTPTIILTWDALFSPDWRKVGFGGNYDNVAVPQYYHKEFNTEFDDNGVGDGVISFEPGTSYRTGTATHIPTNVRLYIKEVSDGGQVNYPTVKGLGTAPYSLPVGQWVRYVQEIRMNQPASAFTDWIAAGGTIGTDTYHMLTQWYLDPVTGPVRAIFRVPFVNYRGAGGSLPRNFLTDWVAEHNTSSPVGALVAPCNIWIRNFVALRGYILPTTPENDTLIFERPT